MAVGNINDSRAAFVQSFDRREVGGWVHRAWSLDSVLVCAMLVFQSNDLTIQRTGNTVVDMSPSQICSWALSTDRVHRSDRYRTIVCQANWKKPSVTLIKGGLTATPLYYFLSLVKGGVKCFQRGFKPPPPPDKSTTGFTVPQLAQTDLPVLTCR